jgi:NADH-quinone oxidoreductase subunit A
MASPTAIAAYLTLFLVVGAVFLFVNLFVGWLVRPNDPHAEKKEIYECGEPAIGSSFVQFDLRFYVVALVFIVFDAEVAFLFPAATVFGKQAQLSDVRMPLFAESDKEGEAGAVAATDGAAKGLQKPVLSSAAKGVFDELGMASPVSANATGEAKGDVGMATLASEQLRQTIDRFTLYVYCATLLFFLVLFVGFAYEWKTGAFDWVRAVTRPRPLEER